LEEDKMRHTTHILALVLLAASSFVTAATYYMTISEVTFLSSGPYVKDQYSLGIKVTYSAPAGVSTTNCRAKIIALPSGWAVLDDYNLNYKTLSACSGSATFELMPTTTGTFSAADIVVEVTGTDAGGESTVNAGTKSPSGTIVVESQPILELTVLNTSDTSNLSINDSFTVDYQVTNTGGASTSSTSNLRLSLSSNPFNSVVFGNGLTSDTVGSGSLAAAQKITGKATLKIASDVTSNNLNYTLTATADNTVHRSQVATQNVQCVDCLLTTAADIMLTGGWNLISLPLASS